MSNSLEFIILAYGESRYLKQCIESLLDQKVKCRISISTSTPSNFLYDLSKFYKIPIHTNTVRGSIAADWNYALERATADLVVLAHQDDIYDAKFSETALNFFRTYPGAGIVFTAAKEMIKEKLSIYNKREMIKSIICQFAFVGKSIIKGQYGVFRLLAFGCPIPCPSVIFNREITRNFYFDDSFSVNLDWDLWSRVGLSGAQIGFINNQLLIHRIHENAETHLAKEELRRQNEDYRMFLKFWPPRIARLIHMVYKLSY